MVMGQGLQGGKKLNRQRDTVGAPRRGSDGHGDPEAGKCSIVRVKRARHRAPLFPWFYTN